jgi:hypothetical protein
MRESVFKKKQEMYNALISSSESENEEEEKNSQFNHPLPNLLCPQTTERVKKLKTPLPPPPPPPPSNEI